MSRSSMKRISSLLAILMLVTTMIAAVPTVGAVPAGTPGTPYKANGTYDVTVPHVFINQVYGNKVDVEASSTHSFIELYNPTDSNVDLSGWSLQYSQCISEAENCPAGSTAWVKLDLTQTIKAHSSYLVVANATTSTASTKLTVNPADADQLWNGQVMISKGIKVALMSNSTLLTEANPFAASPKPAGYVDMLGAGSNDEPTSIDGAEGTILSGPGFSKKKSLRRVSLTDTDNYKVDFEAVDYSNASNVAKGPHYSQAGAWFSPLGIKTSRLADGFVNSPYSTTINSAVYGGSAPYSYEATGGLPTGVTMSVYGVFSGTPTSAGEYNVALTVTDSVYATMNQTLKLKVYEAPAANAWEVTKIGSYTVGTVNKDGGVAEIVKYNKDNGKFYLVNGFTKKLDIVKLTIGDTAMTTEKSIDVKAMSETNGFVYGDLTSVDVNTTTQSISIAIQELDAAKNGKILVLDYEGNLLKSYEAGVQPDMIKTTSDGRYILTANEAEKRDAAVDPEGGVTVVDTTTGIATNVKFNDLSIIADDVHIRGTSSDASPLITTSGIKADAIFDFEPEYITLSEDQSVAYVSIQEDNAIAALDIANKTFTSVKSLGYKDLSDPNNALDLIKDGMVKLENVPFKGMYMPDGLASYTVSGATYLFTANEGDVTDWTGRKNGSTIGTEKTKLQANTPAEQFLKNNAEYNDVEVASDMGKNDIYLFGGRSFTVWDASTMNPVYDNGNDFEKITAYRIPNNFNASNDDVAKDKRSLKKGPEPEDIKVVKVGDKALAFIGLERTGGVMTYDVTDPTHPVFANYINTRDFAITDFQTDTGPEGIEFIPATQSPTNLPLLLVANEVGGRVAVLQLNVTKVVLDKTSLSVRVGDAPTTLTATVTPAPISGQVTWKSSNPSVATVDGTGKVTPVAVGNTVITATSADGYGVAESKVSVERAISNGSGSGIYLPPTTPATITPVADGKSATVELTAPMDASGTAKASLSEAQVTDLLKAVSAATATDGATIVIKLNVDPQAKESLITLPDAAFAQLSGSNVKEVKIDTDFGIIMLDKTTLTAISVASSTGDVTLSVAKSDNKTVKMNLTPGDQTAFDQVILDRPILEFQIASGGQPVSGFNGGTVKVSVPYKAGANENESLIVTYFISESGEMSVLPNSQYDPATDTLQFSVKHFSKYAVGYNEVKFNDTNASFAKSQIEYLAAREILQGIDTGKFAPESSITRADFALILARLAGADLNGAGQSAFKDVKADSYYAQAVLWATKAGITNGVTTDEFTPAANVTREQMVTMIVRLAQSMNYALPTTTPATNFADQNLIPAFAVDAANAVQQAGIVSGKSYADRTGSFFAPKDAASRQEAAKMLAIFLQGMNQ